MAIRWPSCFPSYSYVDPCECSRSLSFSRTDWQCRFNFLTDGLAFFSRALCCNVKFMGDSMMAGAVVFHQTSCLASLAQIHPATLFQRPCPSQRWWLACFSHTFIYISCVMYIDVECRMNCLYIPWWYLGYLGLLEALIGRLFVAIGWITCV